MSQAFNLKGKTKQEVMQMLNNFQSELKHEKKLHDTLDHLLEGFQIVDFNYRYVYVNNAVVQQSKLSREQLLGHTMMELYPGVEASELFKTMTLCMEARVPHHFENVFKWADGSSACFLLSIQPTVEGLTILSNDISDKKISEKEKAEYLNDLERIIFLTSHNLRQPITQFQGLMNLLKVRLNGDDELMKIASYLEETATLLDRQSRDLTDLVYAMQIKAKNR